MALDVVYALGSAQVTTADGGRITVRGGSHWPASDPVVLARPDLFSADPRTGISASQRFEDDAPVEQATAAPGERRTTRRA